MPVTIEQMVEQIRPAVTQTGDMIYAQCTFVTREGDLVIRRSASICRAERDMMAAHRTSGRYAEIVGEAVVGRRRRFRRFAKKIAKSRAIRAVKKVAKSKLGKLAIMAAKMTPQGAAAFAAIKHTKRGIRMAKKARRALKGGKKGKKARAQAVTNTVDLLARGDERARQAVAWHRRRAVSGHNEDVEMVGQLRRAYTRRYGRGPEGQVAVGASHICRGYAREDLPMVSTEGVRDGLRRLWDDLRPHVGVSPVSPYAAVRSNYVEGLNILRGQA